MGSADPNYLVKSARLVEQAAGTGLAVYLGIVCGVLRLLFPAARKNLRKHALLFAAMMVASALATWIGASANWWFSPTLIAIYCGYLTLSPAGEIPIAPSRPGDPEQAYSALAAAVRGLGPRS